MRRCHKNNIFCPITVMLHLEEAAACVEHVAKCEAFSGMSKLDSNGLLDIALTLLTDFHYKTEMRGCILI